MTDAQRKKANRLHYHKTKHFLEQMLDNLELARVGDELDPKELAEVLSTLKSGATHRLEKFNEDNV